MAERMPHNPGWHLAPGFEPVAEVFAELLALGLDLGATFAVSLEGECVVDLWGGHRDDGLTRPIERDALFPVWSATKGATATTIALLVDRGVLDYDAPVARYWPEFAASGKERLTVGEMLSHQAGLCGMRRPTTIEDHYAHHRLAAELAAQAPFFPPASAWGYHALTFGILADELVRRVDGRPVARVFQEDLAGPLGLELFMGLPPAELDRQVTITPPPGRQQALVEIPNPAAFEAAFQNPVLEGGMANTTAWKLAGIPGAGLGGNARGLARLYALHANNGVLDGRRWLSAPTVAAARSQRVEGVDQVTGNYRRWAAGFHLNMHGLMGPNPDAFGHAGWGGSIGFADPAGRLAVGYTTNRMLVSPPGELDQRLSELLAAIYAALDARKPPSQSAAKR
ncbi:serine hydrolase [Sphingomonas naphthae]|uniref:Serine hydrolase n=1 Tax=Sphingomonas naphthae TaxID=1813468 RepID=A0ABY7TNG6_9SPHN|nr:serine hydrolase domain-containing protein [Sphingomonas naphthae]WCT74526.1 serine hydrolase [Sphingomonas naphthae]